MTDFPPDWGQPSRWDFVFRALNRPLGRRLVSEPAYYWLLDRLTDNAGWRPLSYREAHKVLGNRERRQAAQRHLAEQREKVTQLVTQQLTLTNGGLIPSRGHVTRSLDPQEPAFRLDADECVLNPDLECQRPDHPTATSDCVTQGWIRRRQ